MELESKDYLKTLTENAVINIGKNHGCYKISEFFAVLGEILKTGDWGSYEKGLAKALINKMSEHKIYIPPEIFENDCDCEILDTEFKSWQKGKLKARLVFEFIPDESEPSEPESPLDEIRKEISQLQQS